MPRFALLEHTGAPDDPGGRHFDLLVELAVVSPEAASPEAAPAGVAPPRSVPAACRTWRLLELPRAGGEAVPALELPPHRLAWLDHVAGEVSGGRGFARRVDAGRFEPLTLDADELAAATEIVLEVSGAILAGRLRLRSRGDGWAVRLD